MRIVWSIYLLFSALGTFAQEPTSFAITQQQGLPSNTVYDLFQDSRGFLWAATENGLARFNGAQFRLYENPRVRSQAVSGIFEATDGRIWLFNFFGEILFVKNDSLQKLASWENLYTEGFPNLASVGNQLIVSVPQKLYSYQPATQVWKNIGSLLNDPDKPLHFNHHLVTQSKDIWVCYSTPQETVVTNLTGSRNFTFPNSLYKMGINRQRLFEWNKKVWLFDPQNQKVFMLVEGIIPQENNSFKKALGQVRNIKNLGDSLLAFLSNDGVDLFTKNNEHRKLLPGKNVGSIAADTEGGLWIGTLNEGIFYFPSLQSTSYPKKENQLFSKLAIDNNNQFLLAGGYEGDISFFSSEGTLTKRIATPAKKEVQSLFVDSAENRLLVFTDKLYSYRLNTLALEKTVELAAVKKIEKVNSDYFLGTSSGLVRLDIKSFAQNNWMAAQRLAALSFDGTTNTLWIGSQKGVVTHNLSTNSFIKWYPDTQDYSPGVSTALSHKGITVLGTYTDGLYLMSNRKVVKHFTTKNGFPSQRISCLSINNNLLYAGTDKGIAIVNLSTHNITLLDETKGLVAKEIYDLQILNNKLWISHPLGLQCFTSLPATNRQRPVLHLTAVISDTTNIKNYYAGITLPPSSQQLSFYFDVSNNLKSRGTTELFYRIKELQNGRWNRTTLLSPQANYLSLPSGSFTLEAYAVNEDGVRSDALLTLAITILTPFWKQLWFIVLLFILSIVFIVLLLLLRFNKITQQSKERMLKQSQEQELRIAQLTSIRAQMNPHFIFNTMALLQGKVLNGLQQEATQIIHDFSLLLRKVLHLSSKEMILLSDEVEVLEKYLAIEKDRFNGTLFYSIEMDNALRDEMIRIPSLLTQPFVENALRHGLMHKQGEKKLTISFNLDKDYFIIRIEDNGIGRKASGEFNKSRATDHQSFALEAYRKRIDLLNSSWKQKIELAIVDNTNAAGHSIGTTVILKVPVEHDTIH